MPALLFRATSARPAAEVFNLPYMSVYLLGGLLTVVGAYVWFAATGVDGTRRGIAVMGTACPNSGFVGYPLMLIAFPDIAGLVLAMNMLVENVIIIPLVLTLIEFGRGSEGATIAAKIGRVLLGVARRPMVIGLLLGLVVTASGLPVPAPLSRLVDMVAASAAPLSLLVIGGSLAGASIHGNRALAGQIVAGKLVLQPALTMIALLVLGTAGLTLAGDLRAAVLITAALPMMGIYTVFGQQEGHEGLTSLSQFAATIMAFATLNILLAALL
jgi:malonate transporter